MRLRAVRYLLFNLARVRDAALKADIWRNCSTSAKTKAKSFARMQQSLIAAQELGDEKMTLLQLILDKIEIKTRLLDQDFKNLGKTTIFS